MRARHWGGFLYAQFARVPCNGGLRGDWASSLRDVTYDLTRLGNARFEHLVQALALRHLGPGVEIFGDGPDGGREATFRGSIDMGGKGDWDGYGVIQAKYKSQLTGTAADQKWFFEQVTAELDLWVDQTKKRHKNQPEYFIIATNVSVSSVEENGGQDRLRRLFAIYRDRVDPRTKKKNGMPKFKDYDLWHADKLDRLLEDNQEISRRYADLILPGDVLSRLFDHVSQTDRKVAAAWIGHITRALSSDIRVELGESGDLTNTHLDLAHVAVDLPSSHLWERPPALSDSTARKLVREHLESLIRHTSNDTALGSLVTRADQVLSPALVPAAQDRVVVLGGPGSGKSTLSRLLCQIYRVALVKEAASGRVTHAVAEKASRISAAFADAGLPEPTLHRLPVRVVLSEFADEVSKPVKPTLLQHIVDTINDRASDPITVPEALRLLETWPLLLMLDGMDEVASATNRDEVTQRISDFLDEMAAHQADVLTVCTSRPIGFENDDRINYQELRLTPLTTQQALGYASRLLQTRFAENPDRRDEVQIRLIKASHSPDTARLMTSPLQVTILSLLLEQATEIPDSRYALFKNYYAVIHARESSKPPGIGDVIRRYRTQLDQLHQQCGLAIHARAENAGDSDSILPISDLESIARRILEAEEQPNPEQLIEQIVKLTRQRLVLLVPRGDGVAFEVRSLAEFFAATALMVGEDELDTLARLIPSAHWRHTWLLAAGYVFSDLIGKRDSLLQLLTDANHESKVNRFVMPGATLAVDALKDGFAANTPKYQKRLVHIALQLIRGPRGGHITNLAQTLAPLMEESEAIRQTVWQEVDASLADNSPGAIRTFLNGLVEADSGTIGATAGNKLDAYMNRPNPEQSAEPSSDATTNAAIRSALDRVIEITLSDNSDEHVVDFAARVSLGDNDADNAAVQQVREIIIDNCGENQRRRATLREILAGALEHDMVNQNPQPTPATLLTPAVSGRPRQSWVEWDRPRPRQRTTAPPLDT